MPSTPSYNCETFAANVHHLSPAERRDACEMLCDLAEQTHRGQTITIGDTIIDPTSALAERYLRLAEILAKRDEASSG